MTKLSIKDTQSRKWFITFEDFKARGWERERITKAIKDNYKSLQYFCICDEIGALTNRLHCHLYVVGQNPIRFSRLRDMFSGSSAHIETANGTSQECRDYCRKEGKYLDTDKKDTNLIETFEEFGEMPIERQGVRNDKLDFVAMVKNGASNLEIIEELPQYAERIDDIEKLRQEYRFAEFKDKWRDLEVSYIYGATGKGKTRGVMEKYGYSNVFRVTDYAHPFDSYRGQDVIIFEEFRGNIHCSEMLNYLDGYPLELPCRYANKIACFTKVYILSNIDLFRQFPKTQENENETFKAFLRRINHLTKFNENGEVISEDFRLEVSKLSDS